MTCVDKSWGDFIIDIIAISWLSRKVHWRIILITLIPGYLPLKSPWRCNPEKSLRWSRLATSFKKSSDVDVHPMISHKDFVILCKFCGKWFSCQEDLLSHIRITQCQRRFPCHECDFNYARSDDFVDHTRTLHGVNMLPYCSRFISGFCIIIFLITWWNPWSIFQE